MLHGSVEWAFTQGVFQSLRSWELGKLRRILCFRRRPNEGWVDNMKRTGLIVAKQLKKLNQLRTQNLAMKRVKIAAWQMASCPNDAKGRRYWEEIVTWRCDKHWKEAYGRFTRFFGDDWIPKLAEEMQNIDGVALPDQGF